ncbi:outer membrane protein assembly factor BamB family protein [Tautonia marina]|uniref:outer membrane protein assembly factor BamB family protein n=1 Tax=Tautonia marina TaxID=2653855 RepID=UPI001375DEA5|nr:PQQ-binding-like beta-propeller repeat protein [Tautonia marina]
MIRRLALAWAALGTLALAVTADGQPIETHRILPDRTALGRVGLERSWFATVPLQSGLEQVDHLSLTTDGTQIFAQTTEANLYCYDSETGRMLWKANLGPASGLAQDVGTNSTLAFATNGNYIFALDRATGRQVWVERMEANASSPIVATDELVFIGEDNGKLLAFSLKPAEDPRFQKETGAPGGFAWNFSTNGPITAEPVATQFVVAFASTGGKLYVTRYDPPSILHRSQDIGPLTASMGTYGSGPESLLVVPSMNRNLYGINLFTGEQKWVFSTRSPISAQPLVGGGDVTITRRVPERRTQTIIGTDLKPYEQEYTEVVEQDEVLPMPPTVYVLSDDGDLYAVNPDTGESRWTSVVPIPGTEQERVDPRTGRTVVIPGTAQLVTNASTGEPVTQARGVRTGAEQILALSPSRVYLRTQYGDLAIVDRESGELVAGPSATFQRAGVDLRRYAITTTNDSHDRMYLASPHGSIVCLREFGSTSPVPLRAESTSPFGYLRDEEGSTGATPPPVPSAPFGNDLAPDDNQPADADNPFDVGFGARPLPRNITTQRR